MIMNYRKCVYCLSPWVCWNWFADEKQEEWSHECWDCDNVQSTTEEVKDGIPYEELKNTYPEEHKIRGEILACNESILHWCQEMVKSPKDESHYLRLIKEHILIRDKYMLDFRKIKSSKK